MLPHGRISVLAKTLVVEAVDLSDLARLVVSAEDCYSLAVSNLEFRNFELETLGTIDMYLCLYTINKR